jgi:hypothetical protein
VWVVLRLEGAKKVNSREGDVTSVYRQTAREHGQWAELEERRRPTKRMKTSAKWVGRMSPDPVTTHVSPHFSDLNYFIVSPPLIYCSYIYNDPDSIHPVISPDILAEVGRALE